MPKKIDWAKINSVLPRDKSAASTQKRKDLFKQFDPNNNGYLSLAEVDKGVRDVLALDELFEVKPVLMRAFQKAKSYNGGNMKHCSRGPDYVEYCEFRVLLVYLREYLELWQMFDELDSSDDRRINKAEFIKAVPKLAEWGVKVDNPDATFAKIDKNGGGFLLFSEFATWAIDLNLDLPDDVE